MLETKEQRNICYDRDLGIEAYQLTGIVQKFPNHFHEYYVIGFIEGGRRHLWCKQEEYEVERGDLILFNPGENHCCAPVNGEILDYRGLNISREIMKKAVEEITGSSYLPYFKQSVVVQSELSGSIGDVFDAIRQEAPCLEKEEAFCFLIEQLLEEYSTPYDSDRVKKPDEPVRKVCEYLTEHYTENVSLEELTAIAGFGKSYLLRCFTKQVGVSPYRFLQNIRLERSKKLLEEGIALIEIAGRTGFSDQSHFTNFFKEYIGLTPKQYQRIYRTHQEDTNENE